MAITRKLTLFILLGFIVSTTAVFAKGSSVNYNSAACKSYLNGPY